MLVTSGRGLSFFLVSLLLSKLLNLPALLYGAVGYTLFTYAVFRALTWPQRPAVALEAATAPSA